MHRDQGRRAACVHGYRRPLQPQDVRYSSGGNAVCVARPHIRVNGTPAALELHQKVVAVTQADKDAGSRTGQAIRILSGVFQRFPAHFKQNPLLRVHSRCFAWRDSEELRIEFLNPIQEAAPARAHFPWRVGIGIIERVDVPTPGRYLADGVAAFDQQSPERIRIVCAARESAADSSHRDRFSRALLEAAQLVVQLHRQQRQALRRQLRYAFKKITHCALAPPSLSSRSISSSSRFSISSSISDPPDTEEDEAGPDGASSRPRTLRLRYLAKTSTVG